MRYAMLLALAVAVPIHAVSAQTPAETSITTSRVDSQNYHSKVLDLDRHILVYLPRDYDAHPGRQYPVLFLRHGGGGNETNWIERGTAPPILDDLIANGRATPMIVVFTIGQLPDALGSNYDTPGLTAAARELVEDVVPFIESKYRVRPGAANRAVAGLSMGAGQSFAIAMGYPSTFAAVGVFSAGTFGIDTTPVRGGAPPPAPAPGAKPNPPLRPFDPQRDAGPAFANPAAFNRQLPLLYISVGDLDPRATPTANAIRLMRSKGLKIASAVQTGGHEWSVWKVALADFVPRLFR